MLPTLFEKLQLKNEKNLLIQGLPSTIEKQFAKLSFAKNVTPLIKIRKIDFALIFALNQTQLNGILMEVIPALQPSSKLWIAFPKSTSKIVSDLNRGCNWNYLRKNDFEIDSLVTLDYVWNALLFKKSPLNNEEVNKEPKITPTAGKKKALQHEEIENYI
jgi:hypothetical protein